MADVDVGPQSLRDAAKGSRALGGELRAVDPSVVDRIKQAMPESGAALNAHRVSSCWEKKFTRLSTALDERADKLVAAADLYDSGERDASSDFDRTAPTPAPRSKRHPGW